MVDIIPQDPLRTARVIGDVLPPFTPTIKMSVMYGKNEVFNGDAFLPSIVTKEPIVKIDPESDESDSDSFFTLIMTDIDVPGPSDRVLREYLHWILTDIPGKLAHESFDSCLHCSSKLGVDLVPYEKPDPNIKIRRFVFALFKQRREKCVISPLSRGYFSTMTFASENHLGLPVAAVFFYSQRETITTETQVHDDYIE